MIALKAVLVPTDFSDTSDVALRYGKALAGAFGASLHVLHVVQEPFAQPWAVEAYGFSLADAAGGMDARSRARASSRRSRPEERSTYRAETLTCWAIRSSRSSSTPRRSRSI